jgi:hypothetical protein
LGNDDNFVLTLMKAKKHDPIGYPETFHVGLYLDNPAAVHTKHDELAAASLCPGEIQGVDRNNVRGTRFLLHRSRQRRCRNRHTTKPLMI